MLDERVLLDLLFYAAKNMVEITSNDSPSSQVLVRLHKLLCLCCLIDVNMAEIKWNHCHLYVKIRLLL